jgi:arabinoxylan arabinofuranohydrolase
MNPILPLNYFIPDVEAHQWIDGRVYLYGSYDISGNTSYGSYQYHVFSSDDMVNWTDHGVSFNTFSDSMNEPWAGKILYAPDCIYKDGTYFLYFCTSDNGEGIATSNVPYGTFSQTTAVKGASGDAIDPAAFVDDDGQVYYYWGQFHLRGAKLKDNMTEIDDSTFCDNLLTEEEHGFHEGVSVRKRNGIYYLVYTDISRGRATSIGYATGTTPFGPFKKGGIIIDNVGCDRKSWNNHGSITEVNGNWFVFYHRSSQSTVMNRRVCVEPIYFNDDGSINEVEMTTQGVSDSIDAQTTLDACRACLLSGLVRTNVGGLDKNAEDTYEYLSFIVNGDWAGYKYINFGSGTALFEICAASLTQGGTVEIIIDSHDGDLIGKCKVPHTGGWEKWQTVSCNIQPVSGVHAVYLVFHGERGRLFNIKEFKFIR